MGDTVGLNVDSADCMPDASAQDLDFLAGGGETGARMRALDWTRTPLGRPLEWPQSLKTIVRVMLDSRYAMWMLWGSELTFFCNDAYLPTVGIKRDWVLGARSDKVWEEIWPDIGPRIEQVLRDGRATWDEALLLFLERSGFAEETYHTFSYSPVYDDANRIAGMLCVVTEVTERVIGERRLRALRDLAARASGASDTLDTCRRACAVLAEYPLDVPFAALYLFARDADAAQLAACTLAPGVLPAVFDVRDAGMRWPLHGVIATQQPQMTDMMALGLRITAGSWSDLVQQALLLPLKGGAQEGLTGFLVAGISPRRAPDDAYRAFLGLVANQLGSAITQAQAYEAERRRAQALDDLNRAKTAFFSNISHEFRTPLTLMLGPLEDALVDPRLPADLKEQLELVQRNAARMHKLVNSLLDFSRIEAGRMQAWYEPTDLSRLTRDLASTFRSAMERAGLIFEVQCADLGAPVYVDRDMWEKIVLNLLSNAFKFTLAGRVTVDLSPDDTHAILAIADTGIGIPEDELPRLFERFHRVESVQGRTHEGSGIGLALVQELVKLHQGSIEAISRLNHGTTFNVRIPLGTAHLPEERVRSKAMARESALASATYVQEALRWLRTPVNVERFDAPAVMEEDPAVGDRRFAATFGSRIVLADDNADMRDYVAHLLARHYRVEPVADGEQALQAARRAAPDLVLTDVMMPRMDGFQLLAQLRTDAQLRGVPILMLSARAGEEARIEGLDAGADDYLIKPFSARELLARVGALLELRHMRQASEHAFRRRTAQFETLLSEAPLGVYLIDGALRFREANAIARAAFGDAPDLIGSDFEAVMLRQRAAQYAEEIVRRFRRTLETGEPYFTPECVERRPGGGAGKTYEWRISRIPLPEGGHGVVCYFRDISQQVDARKRLEAADRQKNEFLAMLAHELRNPLAPLRTASEILTRIAPDAGAMHGVIGIIRRQVRSLARLVDDLLDMSRVTQGRITLRKRPVSMMEVVHEALEVVDSLMRERRHRISLQSSDALFVIGDATRLVQCVANLLTNAAKYTDPDGEIRIQVRRQADFACVSVTDNGAGIPADLLPRVFDLFVQSDRTLDRAEGGLGIGLSVVKRLIEMHRGSVSARSDGPGCGASFEIRLPVAAVRC